MSGVAPPAGEDEWETQTTRKQRKQQKKAEAPATAEAASSVPAAAAAAAAASSSEAVAVAASDSSFPVTTGDDTGMEGDFLDAGLVGLDGETIPKGAPTFQPPVQTSFVPRRQKFAFDPNTLPKCFVCQTRHDMGACRKKEKVKG